MEHGNPIELFLSRLDKVSKSGRGWKACCPAHNDKNPSFIIGEGESKEGKATVMFHCFSGCTPDEILQSVGLTWNDLYLDNHREKSYDPQPDEMWLEIFSNHVKSGGEVTQLDINQAEMRKERLANHG